MAIDLLVNQQINLLFCIQRLHHIWYNYCLPSGRKRILYLEGQNILDTDLNVNTETITHTQTHPGLSSSCAPAVLIETLLGARYAIFCHWLTSSVNPVYCVW